MGQHRDTPRGSSPLPALERASRRSLRLLLIEDSEDDAALVLRELDRGGFDVTYEQVQSAAALNVLLNRTSDWELVISDYSMPSFDAPSALAVVRGRGLDVPFIIASGTVDEETAVAAMRAGAQDFVPKHRMTRLIPAVERELREAKTRSEQRRLEEHVRRTQKMDAIGALASGVAHDFNNVLSVIMSYAELAIADLGPGHPMRADLAEIRSASQRGADLTRQLLAFSRQQTLEPRNLDVGEVAVAMEKMLRRLVGEDVDLVLTAAPTGAGTVYADHSQLEQVFMNLVVNARDAMTGGGKLFVTTETIVVNAEHAAREASVGPGSYVRISVRDTGCGMDAATLARIFEPFFTTKEPGKGTGLGLSTVFGIVEQSGGRIAVESEPGKGSTFRVYLPQVQQEADAHPTAPPTSSALRGSETVLLVEDDEPVRRIMCQTLRKYGYRVVEASDGAEAIRTASGFAGGIDLLVTDVVMPRMGGRELAQRLTTERPRVRVLFVSGYPEKALACKGVLDASNTYMSKPVTPDAFVRRVREVLGNAA
jgi:two-component system cell cycle sensor histidine kinase/response regulator CckA